MIRLKLNAGHGRAGLWKASVILPSGRLVSWTASRPDIVLSGIPGLRGEVNLEGGE